MARPEQEKPPSLGRGFFVIGTDIDQGFSDHGKKRRIHLPIGFLDLGLRDLDGVL